MQTERPFYTNEADSRSIFAYIVHRVNLI